jgi:YNFM family putative membrane transporter
LLPGPLAAWGGWPLAATVVALLTVVAGALMAFLLPPSVGFTPRPVGLREALLGTLAAPADRVVALLCVVGFAAMGAFVGVYNATAFRLQAPPFELGAAASLVYLAYPIGIASPLVARRLAQRIGRGRVVGAGLGLLAGSVLLLSLPNLAAVVVGLALVGFAFLGVHSMLSGWVVDRARRRGRGTAQASSAYLGTYYLGSTIAGALATLLWQNGGWGGVAVLAVFLAGVAFVASLAADHSDRPSAVTEEDEPAAL